MSHESKLCPSRSLTELGSILFEHIGVIRRRQDNVIGSETLARVQNEVPMK